MENKEALEKVERWISKALDSVEDFTYTKEVFHRNRAMDNFKTALNYLEDVVDPKIKEQIKKIYDSAHDKMFSSESIDNVFKVNAIMNLHQDKKPYNMAAIMGSIAAKEKNQLGNPSTAPYTMAAMMNEINNRTKLK